MEDKPDRPKRIRRPRNQSKPRAVPFVSTTEVVSAFARRPVTRQDAAPPLEQLHKDILATKDQPDDSERGSVRVNWDRDPTALIKSVRSVIRRNGNKGISVATKREKGYVLFWVTPLKKRASRRKPTPPVKEEPLIERSYGALDPATLPAEAAASSIRDEKKGE